VWSNGRIEVIASSLREIVESPAFLRILLSLLDCFAVSFVDGLDFDCGLPFAISDIEHSQTPFHNTLADADALVLPFTLGVIRPAMFERCFETSCDL
jgi:hypothetical protein